MGYCRVIDPEFGTAFESDTKTCAHCQSIWDVKSSRPDQAHRGAWCQYCGTTTCPRPECLQAGCTPFMARIEAQEARSRLLEAITG